VEEKLSGRSSRLAAKERANQALISYAASHAGAFPQPHKSIFRYVNFKNSSAWDYCEETVAKNKLPLTTPTSFNDPFDSNPVIVNNISVDDFNKYFRGKEIVDPNTNAKIKIDTKTLRIQNEDGSILSGSELEEFVIRSMHHTLSNISHDAKVASFSRRISSQLLWAHYADGHKGMAYHFLTSADPKSILHYVRPVEYVAQRPIIPISEILSAFEGTDGTNKYISWLNTSAKLYLQKSVEWNYEQEERVVAQEHNSNAFNENELASLIVGPTFSDNDLSHLKAIAARRTRPLKIYRSTISRNEYSIEVLWDQPI
jgi:hypothetical protein